MADYTRRRSSNGAVPASNGTTTPDSMQLQYPALVEELTLTEWAPDENRVTSTLLLFVEDGLWKACLHDRDSQKSCFVSGLSLSGLLASVEQGLREDDLDWRSKRPVPGKKR
jgi:hypothetical protein